MHQRGPIGPEPVIQPHGQGTEVTKKFNTKMRGCPPGKNTQVHKAANRFRVTVKEGKGGKDFKVPGFKRGEAHHNRSM